MIPVKKMPSKVPALPMEATGAPNSGIFFKFNKSAPLRVPKEPAT